MSQLDTLNSAVATLQTDVAALIASQAPVDLTAVTAVVNAIDATVKAATPVPTA